MAEIYDFSSGELIKTTKSHKGSLRKVGRQSVKSELSLVELSSSEEDRVDKVVRLGLAVSEALSELIGSNSTMTLIEVQAIINEHTQSLGELSPAEQDQAVKQTNLLTEGQRIKEK